MAYGSGTKATGGKQRGAKPVTGSTSTVKLGKSAKVKYSKTGMKKY
jgi:hypothetical protein